MNEEKKAVEKKTQKRIYTDSEMSLITNTFKDNDGLIRAIRKVMLQMPLEESDATNVESLKKNKLLVALLRKVFLPTLDPNAPLVQLVDLWLTVQLNDKSPEQAYPHLQARATLIDYLDQQLSRLEGVEPQRDIVFDELLPDDKDPDQAYSDLLARNTAINHVEMQLNVLKVLANQEETPEEAVMRLSKDSSK